MHIAVVLFYIIYFLKIVKNELHDYYAKLSTTKKYVKTDYQGYFILFHILTHLHVYVYI